MTDQLKTFVEKLIEQDAGKTGTERYLAYETAKAKIWIDSDSEQEYTLAIQEYVDGVKLCPHYPGPAGQGNP